MESKDFYILGVIAIVIAVIVLRNAYKRHQEWRVSDIDIPPPDKLRTDLLFGYYGVLDNKLDGEQSSQVDETKNHTNLLWEFNLKSPDAVINNIRKAAMFTVLDLAPYLFTNISRENNIFNENAEQNLRDWLDRLKREDVLKYVKGLTPIDEPNLNTTKEELLKALAVMRKVIPDYPELRDVKLFCIFSGYKEYFCVQEFDVVALDKYERKSSILAKGNMYDQLRKQMKEGQRTMLVLGGSYNQNPTPFIHYAHSHSEVLVVLCFLWADTEDNGEVIHGIRSLPVKDAYIQAGLAIINS